VQQFDVTFYVCNIVSRKVYIIKYGPSKVQLHFNLPKPNKPQLILIFKSSATIGHGDWKLVRYNTHDEGSQREATSNQRFFNIRI